MAVTVTVSDSLTGRTASFDPQTANDAIEFLLAGASAVQVGTANLYDPGAPARIARELDRALHEMGEHSVRAVIGSLRTD